MNKILTFTLSIIGLMFFISPISAQVKPVGTEKPKTDLELFQEKYGTVIVQGFSRVGVIKGIGGTFQITVKEYKTSNTSTKVKGLLVEIDTGERYSSSARSFIEFSEIESLIKGITYISKIDKTATTLESFQADYTTKDDFRVSVFNDSAGKLNAAIKVGSIGGKTIYVDVSMLADLLAKLESAKASLDVL